MSATTPSALRVLVVDDEQAIIDVVALGLSYEGFEVQSSVTGRQALELAQTFRPHIVILDLNLPDLDGLEVCRRLRAATDALIVMLTARDEVRERVRGLEEGADDYLTKPFYFPELLARIRALLRRTHQPASDVLQIGPVLLNVSTREAFRNGQLVALSRKEFDLLHLFLRHPNQVLERETILNQVWGYDYFGSDTIIEVYIRYLRQKFDTDPPTLIKTVRGVGYMLKTPL
ncbi:MAG: response regulator transcription factor [Chloroflexi bacterium OHK40]